MKNILAVVLALLAHSALAQVYNPPAAGAGSGDVVASGTLTANRLIIGGGTSIVSALGSLGTTTTVLHGNAAGAPTFGAVSLSADVSGNLPVGNLNSGTSASATTYWRGDGTWATPAGGGSVSVTAGTPNVVITPSPGTGTFTVGTTAALNTQSGNSAYTILSTDAGKIVNRTNTVTQSDPIPQATGSFASGFSFSYQTGTVGNTLTSTTSTINGIAGATGIRLAAQQAADCFSDGTNWHCALGMPQNATQSASVGWIATVNPNKAILATLNQAVRVTSIVGRVSDATGGTSTVQVNKAPSATACASGTALHSGTLNANGTANTNQTLTLVGGATDDLAVGDSLCLVTTGTTEWTGGTGIGSVTVNYQPI